MKKRNAAILCVALLAGYGLCRQEPASAAGGSYEDLVRLFQDWREFQRPAFRDQVPDFTAAVMAAQKRRLPELQKRLAAIDPSNWPVGQQIDHRLLRAEMNGLEFDHRVLRPWSRNPCFYTVVHASESDTPLREGESLPGTIELWRYHFPASAPEVTELQGKLRAIPEILAQARVNLVEDARDLWLLGARVKKSESETLAGLAKTLATHHPDLVPDVERARRAVDEFRAWLEEKQGRMSAPSGVGVENYDWYLRNVHLVPYTWRDEVALMERELSRSVAYMKLEEHRNRSLPRLEPAGSEEEYQRRFQDAVSEYMRFLREKEILTVADYMEPALRARVGSYFPPPERDFFVQVDLRDPMPLRCHGHHWFDRARGEREPHASPIRRPPLLYNIWDGRAEGLATAMEELMMGAGLYDGRPRSRELVYIMVAMRAARALAGLRMHSREFTIEQAVRFASETVPYGWLKADGETVWFEQQLYLEQPGYGSSYLTGKAQIEALLAERSRQLGEAFTVKRFFDELHASGMIPVSMIRWEMTGGDDEARTLAAP